MSEENKTKLRLQIDKTIQPQQFEPIKVSVDIEETVYWKNEKDRQKKITSHVNKMTDDFIFTFNQVVERIGEPGRCIGRVATSDKSLINDNSKKATTEAEKNTVLDELDNDWS